ncbi:MAG: hypothetical protein J0H42_26880 [Rhizobiales bacterium]|nr:hypothetical protein [Hyphomicrobiales bacterium]
MAKKVHPPRQTTSVSTPNKRQLADLATLLGLMQAASKLSQDLDALANEVGGSLEKIAARFGVPFWDVHNAYEKQISMTPEVKPKRRATSRRRKAKSFRTVMANFDKLTKETQ